MPWPRLAIWDGERDIGRDASGAGRAGAADRVETEGLSLRAIAARLGRAGSTVSCELRCSTLPRSSYLPVHAEGCYCERRQRPAVLERDERLGRFVRERLLEGWTAEQIAGWLKCCEERGLRPVSTKTIDAFVHRTGQRGKKL